MTYIVTELGPIDRHAPGTDVTGIYSADVMARLIDEGYIAAAEDASESHVDAVENDGHEDDYTGVMVADIEDEDGE